MGLLILVNASLLRQLQQQPAGTAAGLHRRQPTIPLLDQRLSILQLRLFATLTRTSQKRAKSDPVTPFFSTNPFHSSSLFVTLKLVISVFATHSKSTRGYPCPSILLNHYLNFVHRSLIELTHLEPEVTQLPAATPLESAVTEKWGGGTTYG
jgi:hypothetical protein